MIETKNLYLLDRNVVILIKQHNSGVRSGDGKKVKMIEFLRGIDIPSSSISILLSVIEGQKGRIETGWEKFDCLRKEAAAVQEFFRAARVDADALLGGRDNFVRVFGRPPEGGWGGCESFLRNVAPKITNPIKKIDRRSAVLDIIGEAEIAGVPRSHPIVIAAISCVYRCAFACRLLKIKNGDEKIYNPVSDLMMIPRISLVVDVLKMAGFDSVKLSFLTLDKDLLDFIEITSPWECRGGEGGVSEISLCAPIELFPEISGNEYREIVSLLRSEPYFSGNY